MANGGNSPIQQLISLPGTVYGVGHEAQRAAVLYAALTGRDFKSHVSAASDLSASSNDLVVCTAAQLTAKLMHRLYVGRGIEGAPGIITAPSGLGLMHACAQLAERMAATHQGNPRRVFMHPLLEFSETKRGHDRFISGRASREELVEALSSGPSVLFINTHGDGHDIFLSPKHFACPYRERIETGHLIPMCQIQNECRRLSPSRVTINEAWASGRLIPLSAMKADTIVIWSCSTLRTQDGILDPGYGIVPKLFLQATFRALVTTWRDESFIEDGQDVNALMNDLSAGHTVGSAVARFNNSEYATMRGTNLCVLGDPCVVSPGAHLSNLLPIFEAPRSGIKSSEVINSGNSLHRERAELLHQAVTAVLRSGGMHFDPITGNALVALIKNYESSEEKVGSEVLRELACEIDKKLLEFIEPAPWLTYFHPEHFTKNMSENGTCICCSERSRAFLMVFPNSNVKPWNAVNCPHCGTSVRPNGWILSIDLTRLGERIVSLRGVPANAHVMFSIHVIYGWKEPAFSACSQTNAESELQFSIPAGLAALTLRCNIRVACDLELAFIGFNFVETTDGRILDPVRNQIAVNVSHNP